MNLMNNLNDLNDLNNLNVFAKPIIKCSSDPLTGWHRNGFCYYDVKDHGNHLICGLVTNEFLDFTFKKGNNLKGLIKEGDFWCFCVNRWIEAYNYNPKIAPKIKLESTSIRVLSYISKELLLKYSI